MLRLFFRTAHDELAYVHDALGLHPEDLDAIERARDPQGRVLHLPSSTPKRTAARRSGSTSATSSTGPARADPHRDQPLRQLALAEADGDAWDALRLLVDPAWHRERAEQLAAGPLDDDHAVRTRDRGRTAATDAGARRSRGAKRARAAVRRAPASAPMPAGPGRRRRAAGGGCWPPRRSRCSALIVLVVLLARRRRAAAVRHRRRRCRATSPARARSAASPAPA